MSKAIFLAEESARNLWPVGSLSMQRYWATGSEHLARQDSGLPQIFKLKVFKSEKRFNNINVVVWRKVKQENSTLPVVVRGSKLLHA